MRQATVVLWNGVEGWCIPVEGGSWVYLNGAAILNRGLSWNPSMVAPGTLIGFHTAPSSRGFPVATTVTILLAAPAGGLATLSGEPSGGAAYLPDSI